MNHTNGGSTFIGELDGSISSRLKSLENVFQNALLSPQITNDILGVIWGKFIVNCGINPLCAVTGLRSGEIFQNTAADEMQTKILEEIMAVVKAKGIKAPKKDMITYVKDLSSSRYNKPSMLQHIEAGRLTEIDSLKWGGGIGSKSSEYKCSFQSSFG